PVDRLHGLVEFIRRADRCFEDGPEHANGGAEPEVGAVEHVAATAELHAAASGRDVVGAELPQLVGEDGFDAPATGGEIALQTHAAVPWPLTWPLDPRG